MTNLAQGRPATQSSVSAFSRGRTETEDAAGGTDGDLSAPYSFHTATEQDPWWQVDLGREAVIEKVVIHNRPDQPGRLTRFSLLASREGRAWVAFYRKRDSFVFGGGGAPFTVVAPPNLVARHIRLRLDGFDCLHAREIEVHGEWSTGAPADPLPDTARFIEVEGYSVLVDEARYSPTMVQALDSGHYEARERHVIRATLRPGDRVLEVGTAVGVGTMVMASIVGAPAVMTFDANPQMAADARGNFVRNGLSATKSRHGLLKSRAAIGPGAQPTAPFFIARDFWASRCDALASDPQIVAVEQVPVHCLEDEIAAHRADVLVCDIEGGEVGLLNEADLRGMRKIILETHYWSAGRAAIDALVRKLVVDGFDIDLDLVADHLLVLRRNQPVLNDAEKAEAARRIAAARPSRDAA